MKRGTKLLVLAVTMCALLGVYFGVGAAVKRSEQAQALEESTGSSESLAVGGYDDIDVMDWTYGGVQVCLQKDEDGQWYCPDDPDCPIDQSKAAIMQSAASAVMGTLYVQDAESLDDYGVNEPELTLTVTAGEESCSYAVGAYNELTGTYYMTVDDGTDVYLEDGSLTGSFWYDLENLVEYESLPSDVEQILSLTVESEVGSYALERVDEPLEVCYTDAFDWFSVQDGVYTALDTSGVETLCKKALNISFKTCATWSADAAALAEYGLDAPQGTVTVSCLDTEGETQTVTLEFGDYTDGGEVYVRLAGSKMVYRADGSVLDAFMYADLSDLAPENFLALDGAVIESLTLAVGDQSHAVDPELEDVLDFLEDLSALYSTGTASEDAGRELILSVTAQLDSEVMPEFTAEFYSYNSTSCICVLGGVSHLVSRTSAEALAETAETLLMAR